MTDQMSFFDRVKQRAGVVSHIMHSHEMVRSFNADGDPYGQNVAYSTAGVVIDHEKSLKVLCDIMEEEITILKQKMKTIGFLTEEDMKI